MKRRRMKILGLGIVVFLGFVVAGCSDDDVSARGPFFEKSARKPVLDKTVNRTLMKVDKLYCGSCLAAISQKLSTFDGVIGVGADLNQGLVTVDHTKTLESNKIAEAITSIGYPAKVLSVTEIDSKKTFSSASSRQYGDGCCGGSGYSNTVTGYNEKGSNLSSKENAYSKGCPYIGSVRSRGCYASSSSWKELVERLTGKSDETKTK